VCHNFAKRLIAHGCDPKKVQVSHSGIDCFHFRYKLRKMPKNKVIRIITVARLSEMKGHEYAIRAIKRVQKHYPNIMYEIIGEGKQRVFFAKVNK